MVSYICSMKTNQLMKREFGGSYITQRTSDGFFNATELLKQYNENTGEDRRMYDFFNSKSTKRFITELTRDLNNNNKKVRYLEKDVYQITRGRYGNTFMNPYLFVRFSMWLSVEFEVQIIKWVHDNLIDFRNQAGNHYKEMCDVIQKRYKDHFGKEPNPLVFINEANFLNLLVFGDTKPRRRNQATEEQLDKMNRLQIANMKLIKSNISVDKRKETLKTFSELI